MFETAMTLKDGTKVTSIAETVIDGKTLTLKDITIYSNAGDVPNAVGATQFRQSLDVIMKQAKAQGFETLRITGQRAANSTSANPGKLIDITLDLTK